MLNMQIEYFNKSAYYWFFWVQLKNVACCNLQNFCRKYLSLVILEKKKKYFTNKKYFDIIIKSIF